jgi:TonB family protein
VDTIRIVTSLAVAASIVGTPAVAREWPETAGWRIMEDDPFACAMDTRAGAAPTLLLVLRNDGDFALSIRDALPELGKPETMRVNGHSYAFRSEGMDPAQRAQFLDDMAAGAALELLDQAGRVLSRVSLKGSSAAIAELRRCTEEVGGTVRTQLSTGAIDLEGDPDEPAPPPPAGQRARGNLARYFLNDDYPHSAIRENAEGVVRYRLTIDPGGRVARCAVTQTSGFPALDVKTCQIFLERARLEPARDARGEPVSDVIFSRIVWRFDPSAAGPTEVLAPPAPPPVPPAPPRTGPTPATPRAPLESLVSVEDYPVAALAAREEGLVEFRLDVGANGRTTGCTITRSSGSSVLDSTTCRLMRFRARFMPALDAAAQPRPDTVASAVRWELPASRRLPGAQSDSGAPLPPSD